MKRVRELMGRYMERMDDEEVYNLVHQCYFSMVEDERERFAEQRRHLYGSLPSGALWAMYDFLIARLRKNCIDEHSFDDGLFIQFKVVRELLLERGEKERPWWKFWS